MESNGLPDKQTAYSNWHLLCVRKSIATLKATNAGETDLALINIRRAHTATGARRVAAPETDASIVREVLKLSCCSC